MENTAHGTTRAAELPPNLLAKWEAHQNRTTRSHPLYQVSSADYGKIPRGVEVQLKNPEAGKGGGFSDTFVPLSQGTGKTTLTTSIAKHRYMKELDPM
jgi:hypothetical protein